MDSKRTQIVAAVCALIFIGAGAFFVLKGLGSEGAPSAEMAPVQTSTEDPNLGSAAAESARDISAATQKVPTVETDEPAPVEAMKKVELLQAILAAHNDNDPRLDGELRVLDEPTKKLFRERYSSLPREEQNQRGTIVFLLGRNLNGEKDFQFLGDVLREPPCLSLENCDTPPARVNREEAASDLALSYAQAVALTSLENLLNDKNTKSQATRESAVALIKEGARSPSPTIARLGQKLASRFSR